MPFSREYRDILVIEGNDDDFEATELALSESGGIRNVVRRCRDGLEAWDWLKGKGSASSPDHRSELPGLVIRDFDMPGLDGRDFLRRIRKDDELRAIPVVILTTSNDSADVRSCYAAGANTYVCKPVSWSEFKDTVARLRDYWFDLAVLPEVERA